MAQEPLTERGRRSRERIVDAAAAVVAERGAEGASLDEILAAAGASKSQLYHYFSDKGDLVRAVIARRFGETVDCQGTLLAALDTFAGIRRWFDTMIEENERLGCPGCPLGMLADELADRDEAARGDLIDRADPRRLATAVFASLQGGLLLAKTTKDPQYLRDALDAAYDHLLSFRPAV